MTTDLTWTTLPNTGARVMLDERGVPRLLLLRETDNYADVDLEVEVVTGWRVECRSLTISDDPRGWFRAVEWAGQVAVPCTYDEVRAAPIHGNHRDLKVDVGRLCGMAGVSVVHQLREDWNGHRRGDYLVWVSHPGALGIVREVGVEATLLRLVLAGLGADGGTP